MFGSMKAPFLEKRDGAYYFIFDQSIPGHQHGKTTEIYSHVSTKSIGKIKSPLDNLSLKGGGDV
jgi:hypothetical protein